MSAALPQNQEPFAPASIYESIQNLILNPASMPISAVPPGNLETDCLAHDARNWLTVLQVYCDLLRTSGAVARGYEAWMEELSSAVERGQELVLALIDSVQPTVPALYAAPRYVAVSQPLNIGDAIARRLALFQHLAGSNIHVEIEAPDNIDTPAGNVSLSENAFERIVQNLVGNAIEAMPHGGRLRIVLRAAARTGPTEASNGLLRKTLRLQVHDTGNGIAPERLPCIFDAGVSGKPKSAGRPGQHGFGLAIVRELTERAGGVVRVRSQPGLGSCFEVELPAMEVELPSLDLTGKCLSRCSGEPESFAPGKGTRGIC